MYVPKLNGNGHCGEVWIPPRGWGWASVAPFRLQFREFPPNRTNIVVTSLGGLVTPLQPPRRFGWTIYYVKSVPT